jgi:hypothetical protein
MGFNEKGQPNVKKTYGPLQPGYPNTPTDPN